MTRPNSSFWFVVFAPLLLTGCPPGGVGDPCTPEDEYHQGFSGYSETEVNVESRSFQCETRVCLVNHFRGRVSCPYGQTEGDAAEWETSSDWGNRCRIPGTDGTNAIDRVSVPVSAQKYERRASEAVYCSCRCKNADGSTEDGARYCPCPNGYTCQHLIDDVGLGSSQLAGGYCVKKGTEYDEAETEASPDCTLDFNYPGGWREHPYQCGEAIPY